MTRQTWAIASVALLASSQLFAADTVTRKSDGKKLSGVISAVSKEEVTVKKAVGEPDKIAANDIQGVEWDSGGAELRLAYTDEAGGRYETAITRYTKAKETAKNPSEFLKAELEYALARSAAKQAISEGDMTKLTKSGQVLQVVQKSSPDHFRYYDSMNVLGQVQLAAGDFAAARTSYEVVGKAPWNDYKMLSKISLGKILVAENKLDEAAKEFEAAAAAATNSPSDQARKYEAMLAGARALVTQSKFEESLKILEVVTDKGPADESALQAEAYVLMGNALQALGRMKEASLAYLHVDILFAKEASLHAEALYNLTKTWKQVQLPDRSAEAEQKLVQTYPNSSWRKKLTK
ncbi:MAG: hypothetical protein WCJ09_26410 [Planctomycetota bacterium]